MNHYRKNINRNRKNINRNRKNIDRNRRNIDPNRRNIDRREPGSAGGSPAFVRNQHGGARWLITGIIVFFIALLLIGIMSRMSNQNQLNKMKEETVASVPNVHVAVAKRADFAESGVLPGNIDAVQYASIFARVDGYLKSRLVDIGDHVKAGQLLAEIDTPTVDQHLLQGKEDLAQARANLATAKANLKEAKAKAKAAAADVVKAQAELTYTDVTAKRWQNMASRGAVSLQSRDEKVRANDAQLAQVEAVKAQQAAADQAVAAATSQVNTATAGVAAQVANVERLTAEQNFKYVRAPFDGIITVRKVDPGALISSGSQSQNLELFQMGQIDHLRIYINVPQTTATYLRPGLPADVSVPELPGKLFAGTVSHVSAALDPQTRTLQTEVRLENKDHTLLPGMYAQVKLTVPRIEPWVRIPGTCLVPKADGTYVVLADGGKAHFQKVTIGRDFGDEVEISTGLHGGERVVMSPPVDLVDGETVKAVAAVGSNG